MYEKEYLKKIDPMKAVCAVNDALRRIDERLVNHGERVGYIACRLCELGGLNLDKKILFHLCAFHDIGVYKTDEVDRLFQFESKDVQKHSIYGYLFLKYMTPLNDYAEAILYHHSSWQDMQNSNIVYANYAAMIHLADCIDLYFIHGKQKEEVIKLLNNNNKNEFNIEYLSIAENSIADDLILPQLLDGSYHTENLKMCETFEKSVEEALDYLKMIIYSIDFISSHTVTHTVNTVSIALNIARQFQFDEKEMDEIYLGALIHDIGKIAIPLEILESSGRLSDDEMVIMRTHVYETKRIIQGIVGDNVCQIALRHHEKLDGSGYPKGFCYKDLTIQQRIVAVADIISALSNHRSYKEPFPKDKVITIIKEMSKKQLDPEVCNYVIENYDKIMEETDGSRVEVIDKYIHIKNEYERMILEKRSY